VPNTAEEECHVALKATTSSSENRAGAVQVFCLVRFVESVVEFDE
jgi:hypothetical protein